MNLREIKLPIAALKEDPANPNRMEPDKLAVLGQAMTKFGFLQPIVVRDEGGGYYLILDGHHRVKAAQATGLETVPAIVFGGTVAEAKALSLSMNQLRGQLDLTSVSERMVELQELGWSMEEMAITGFSEAEVSDLLAIAQKTTDELMDEMGATPEPEPDGPPKPFMIELLFSDRDMYQRAKKLLKRAAGPSGDLTDGLLNVLGEEMTT